MSEKPLISGFFKSVTRPGWIALGLLSTCSPATSAEPDQTASQPFLPLENLDLAMDLSVGFDSNPAQSRTGPALGFAELGLEFLQALPAGLRLEGDGWWRDYAGPNDSNRLDLTAAWSPPLKTGALDLWTAAGWYRDQLVTADERDEIALGAVYRRALSARFDLALAGERRWFAYRHRELPWAGRPGGSPLGKQQGGGQGAQTQTTAINDCFDTTNGPHRSGHCHNDTLIPERRNDRLDLLTAETTFLATASLSATLGLNTGWRQSSIQLDAYNQNEVNLLMTYDPNQTLTLTAETGWSRFDYRNAPQSLQRIDNQRWAGLEVRHWLSSGSLYCNISALDSRSTIELEAFTQWTSRCGWQHDF